MFQKGSQSSPQSLKWEKEGKGGCLVLGHLKLGKMEQAVEETDPWPGGQFP